MTKASRILDQEFKTHLEKLLPTQTQSITNRAHLHHPLILPFALSPVLWAFRVCTGCQTSGPGGGSRVFPTSGDKGDETPEGTGEGFELTCSEIVVRSYCRVNRVRGQVHAITVRRQIDWLDLPDEPNVIKAPPGEV
jgi:hypothetical protein